MKYLFFVFALSFSFSCLASLASLASGRYVTRPQDTGCSSMKVVAAEFDNGQVFVRPAIRGIPYNNQPVYVSASYDYSVDSILDLGQLIEVEVQIIFNQEEKDLEIVLFPASPRGLATPSIGYYFGDAVAKGKNLKIVSDISIPKSTSYLWLCHPEQLVSGKRIQTY